MASAFDFAGWDEPIAEESALGYLDRIGKVFARFHQQDSGCLSFGVSVAGRDWFAKTATAPDAVPSLRNATRIHAAVTHPAIIGLARALTVGSAPLLVYPWAPGEVLYHATVPRRVNRRDPASAIARFRALPIRDVHHALHKVLHAHMAVEAAGLVAVDFYDGCLLYDFQTGVMRLCDLDEYRPGPFVLGADRLPGSTRYMAPEQYRRGALIDTRTTVFSLGRMLRLLLDAGDEEAAFRGSAAQLQVIERATRADPEERWESVAALAVAWSDAARPAAGSNVL